MAEKMNIEPKRSSLKFIRSFLAMKKTGENKEHTTIG